MKKKYSILILAIFSLFFTKVYALDSRCNSLFKSIIDNKLNLSIDELDYFKVTDTNYHFKNFFNTETSNWQYTRDKKNNLIISRLNDIGDFQKIENNEKKIQLNLAIGDKLLSINGNKVNKLSDIEIDNLLSAYYDFELTDKQLKDFKFQFQNSKGEKLIKEGSYIQYESRAEASVYIKIKNISDIDVKDNTFNTDLTTSVSWRIENLYHLSKDHLIVDKSKAEYWYCMFTPKEFEKMQIGEVFFENVNSVKQNENLIDDQYQLNISDYLYESQIIDEEKKNFVEITHNKKGNFNFSNSYNLKAFPFDRQILKIKIADLSRSNESLQLIVDNWTVLALQDFKSKGEILEWKIVDTYTNYYNEVDPINTVASSGVELVFEIERNFQYYLFKVIFPIILILLVSWSVFWIHPRELESKLTITIVCLLSLIAYNFVIDKDLPKLSYLTILDYIVLLSYVFATIPNFISIYCFEKQRKRKPIWKIVDRKSRIYGPVIYLTLVFVIIILNVSGNQHTSAFLGFLR